MEKNKDRILRYLSGMIEGEELTTFEIELEKSEELKSEFLEVKLSLEKLNVDFEQADDRYFVNLLPKVREKIEHKSIWNKIPKYAYAAPTLVIILIIGIFTFKRESANELSVKSIVQEIVKNMDDESVTNKYLSELELDLNQNEEQNSNNNINAVLNLDDAVKQKLLNYYDNPITEDITNMKNLSDEDLKSIYNKIAPKN